MGERGATVSFLAALQAVLLLDADFVPSPGLVREYRTPQVWLQGGCGQRFACCTGAWDTSQLGPKAEIQTALGPTWWLQSYAALLVRLGQPQAIVLPAFETHRALNTSMGRQLAMAAARGAELMRSWLHLWTLAPLRNCSASCDRK